MNTIAQKMLMSNVVGQGENKRPHRNADTHNTHTHTAQRESSESYFSTQLRGTDHRVVFPVPHIHKSIILMSNRNKILQVWRETHRGNTEFVAFELTDLKPRGKIEDDNSGSVATLQTRQ